MFQTILRMKRQLYRLDENHVFPFIPFSPVTFFLAIFADNFIVRSQALDL